jgi:hypothetical protein
MSSSHHLTFKIIRARNLSCDMPLYRIESENMLATYTDVGHVAFIQSQSYEQILKHARKLEG